MKTQWPAILYHAISLECYGSPYTLGIFTNEQAAMDRLEVCKRQFNPNCKEEVWLWIETVRNGEVIARRDVPVVTESQRNEVYATA